MLIKNKQNKRENKLRFSISSLNTGLIMSNLINILKLKLKLNFYYYL